MPSVVPLTTLPPSLVPARTCTCREALEAEAQKVAQLAVTAKGTVTKTKKQLEESAAELQAAEAAQQKAEEAVGKIQRLMAEEEAEAEEMAAAGGGAVGDIGEGGTFESAAAGSDVEEGGMEDALWERSQQVQAAAARIAEVQQKVGGTAGDKMLAGICAVMMVGAASSWQQCSPCSGALASWPLPAQCQPGTPAHAPTVMRPAPSQISTLQAKLAGAEDAYKQADCIAQAAMEAAEEAVRDEMETIAGGWAG